MIPTFIILTSAFIFLLISPSSSIIKEKEVKNNASISIDLSFRPSIENKGLTSYNIRSQPLNQKRVKIEIEIPSEKFSEVPLLMEEWMRSPKKWTNNKVKKPINYECRKR